MKIKINNHHTSEWIVLILVVFCMLRFTIMETERYRIFSLEYIFVTLLIIFSVYSFLNKSYLSRVLNMSTMCIVLYIIMMQVYKMVVEEPVNSLTLSLYFNQICILLTIWLIYCFLEEVNIKAKRTICTFYLVCSLITIIYTIGVSVVFGSNAIRDTTHNYWVSSNFKYGGYDFIYGMIVSYTIVVFALKNLVVERKSAKVLFVIYIVACLMMFALSGYSTALILSLAISFLAYTKGPKRYIILIVLALVILVFNDAIINLIGSLGFLSQLTINRLQVMVMALTGEDGTGVYGDRLARMLRSLIIFFDQPFWGGVIKYSGFEFGRHSEWVDQLARYGMLSFSFIAVFFISAYRRIIKKASCSQTRNVIHAAFTAFFFLGIAENISMTLTTFPLFVLAPFIGEVYTIDHES